MRIHAIKGETIVWRCHNPKCQYHHCVGAYPDEECPHHEQKNVSGEYRRVHISHEEVQHVQLPDGSRDPRVVALPQCECGSRDFICVGFDETDLAPPIIKRDPQTNAIVQVDIPGAPNFTIVKQHVERRFVAMDQIIPTVGEVHVTYLNGVPHQVIQITVIDDAYVAPWLAHHLRLGELMKAHGKGPDQ